MSGDSALSFPGAHEGTRGWQIPSITPREFPMNRHAAVRSEVNSSHDAEL